MFHKTWYWCQFLCPQHFFFVTRISGVWTARYCEWLYFGPCLRFGLFVANLAGMLTFDDFLFFVIPCGPSGSNHYAAKVDVFDLCPKSSKCFTLDAKLVHFCESLSALWALSSALILESAKSKPFYKKMNGLSRVRNKDAWWNPHLFPIALFLFIFE